MTQTRNSHQTSKRIRTGGELLPFMVFHLNFSDWGHCALSWVSIQVLNLLPKKPLYRNARSSNTASNVGNLHKAPNLGRVLNRCTIVPFDKGPVKRSSIHNISTLLRSGVTKSHDVSITKFRKTQIYSYSISSVLA
jgi:hypothetical protein